MCPMSVVPLVMPQNSIVYYKTSYIAMYHDIVEILVHL